MCDTSDNFKIQMTLGEISEIMSDGCKFVKLRFGMEDFQKQADAGDREAAKLVEIVHQYHRLCKVIIKEERVST